MRKYTKYDNESYGVYNEIIRSVKINNTEFFIELNKIILDNGNCVDTYWIMGMDIYDYDFKVIYNTLEENIAEAYKLYYAAIREYVEINFIK